MRIIFWAGLTLSLLRQSERAMNGAKAPGSRCGAVRWTTLCTGTESVENGARGLLQAVHRMPTGMLLKVGNLGPE